MTNELISFNFLHEITYTNTRINQVGAGTSTGLRTIPSPAGDIAYVRKFGAQYEITEVTDIEDPIDVNMTFTVKALDGTTLGSRTGGGAFSAGSTVTAQGCYLEISASGGNVTMLADVDIDTDYGGGETLNVVTPQEVIYDGDSRTLYIASGGSTYYDSTMQHGGARHTSALNDNRKTYFHPEDALDALATANDDGVEILDSETYSYPYKDDGGTWKYELTISKSQISIYSTDGQNPKIKSIIGASTEREVTTLYNNANAIFYNENGTNTDTGATGYEDTWHDPYGTIANAITAAGNKGVSYIIYGGTGATVNGSEFITNINLNASYTFEPEYGYICTIRGAYINMTGANSSNFHGFYFDGNLQSNAFNGSGHTGDILINTFINQINAIPFYIAFDGIISNNYFENIAYNVISRSSDNDSCEIKNNIFYSCTKSIGNVIAISCSTGGTTTDVNCHDNLIYDCGTLAGANAIALSVSAGTLSCIIENNTIYNTIGNGMQCIFTGGVLSTTIRDNIIVESSGYDLLAAGASRPTITESNYYTNNGFTIGAGNITTDPEFCKTTSPYKLGISRTSGAYRTDTSSDDMGAHLRIIEINASTIEINGIKIDSNSQFNNALYIVDTANHTGTEILWCLIYDFQGIAIDLYDDNTDLDAIISNNLLYNNGIGGALSYGGNTLEENIFYNNIIYGLWVDYTINTFNHNVFYGNKYGLYIESNSGGNIIKNNIFHENNLYGIYSEINQIITYCCITDGYNSYVDVSDSSNITDDPLFENLTSGSEDFNIKTTEGGYIFNSPCKDIADDDYDIGAYFISRVINDDSWKKYQLETNPRNVTWGKEIINYQTYITDTGLLKKWGIDSKKTLIFSFPTNQQGNAATLKTFQFLLELMSLRQGSYNDGDDIIRVSPKISEHLETGTSATVDASAKTITDSGQSWIMNEWKGYWTGVKFDSDTGNGTITASTKTMAVSPSPAWTVNEWTGYIFHYNGYFYYIKSNTADTLTLSDPDSTFSDTSNIDWKIVKFFKIVSNTDTMLTVKDDDSELANGNYDFYIEFIEMKINMNSMQWSQPRYFWEQETWKSGYEIKLVEY